MSRKPLSAKMRDVARPPEGESFCWITAELLTSAAWQGQSIHCRRLIDFLLNEHLSHAGTENGNLVAPFSQLEQFGLGRRYIEWAIREGEALRLIAVRHGALIASNKAALSRFRLTFYHTREENEFEYRYWVAATNEWRKTTDAEVKAFHDARPPWNKKKNASAHSVTGISDTVSPDPVHTVSPVKKCKPRKSAISEEVGVVTPCALLSRSREGEGEDAPAGLHLWLACLASSQRACAFLLSASEHQRRTATHLSPVSLAMVGMPA